MGQYYNPLFNNLTNSAQSDSSVEAFQSYWNANNDLSQGDISFIYLFTRDYLSSKQKYTKLMKWHYGIQKFWKLKYGENYLSKTINEYTMNSTIDIVSLQKDLIFLVTNYYSNYVVPPYLNLKTKINNLTKTITLHNTLINSSNDQILGWVKYGDNWLLANDPNTLNVFGQNTEWSSIIILTEKFNCLMNWKLIM